MKGVMSVEPTDDGGFTLEVNRSDGVDVTAVVALHHGRPQCHTLKIHSSTSPIDRDLLKSLNLATWLGRASKHVPGAQLTLERPGLSKAFKKQVAVAYLRARREGKNTAEAVAQLGIGRGEHVDEEAPPSTVGRWIAAATDAGYLEPTTQGRKRRVSQPSRNPRGGRTATASPSKRSLSPYSKAAR